MRKNAVLYMWCVAEYRVCSMNAVFVTANSMLGCDKRCTHAASGQGARKGSSDHGAHLQQPLFARTFDILS